MAEMIYGPTFEEMLNPETVEEKTRKAAEAALEKDPLHPVNLYNIHWKDSKGRIRCVVLPRELTGVEARIVVLSGRHFPTGSHKVGAAYSISMEKQLEREIVPGRDTLVWPSTGNYGIGGAWVGPRLGYDSLVVLPEMMSAERFEKIACYGARYIKTPGCESNVKEIYDKTKELKEDPKNRILNQFAEMGNYRFHYHVTGNSIIQMAGQIQNEGIGKGKVAAFVSAMGSAGTIAAGDRIKQVFPDARTVGLEPIQCPTLYNNGFGGHDIQGIGDKHVTWIHNVHNMDALMCISDLQCKKGLQVFSEDAGVDALLSYGISEGTAKSLQGLFGISGICNVLGAIKTARFYELGKEEIVVTVATDSVDRYYSVLEDLAKEQGKMDKNEAKTRIQSIFHGAGLDWIQEGTRNNRDRWHNLKYYTWVEQLGKTVEELNALKDPEFWLKEQERIKEIDRKLIQARTEFVLPKSR
ncbi:MAG: pyridoxal-phosphate dependent enzyme [Armatimonadetes bacterium]|nr:pyridoxal-phosphate dependent enzyme [Armatimonadota bacterium]